MTYQKTSLLVSKQLPEFIREEYPKFISFLEAYYQFLETKQGTQKNDLINESKKIRNISDVDSSLSDFEENFYNTFIPFLPKNTELSKEFLIKNILPLYQSKGTEKSFKLLFRMLYSEELDVEYPRDYILKASDGKWIVENILRVSNKIHSIYVGDGNKTTFTLLPCSCPITGLLLPTDITVEINGILQNSGYTIKKEYLKIVFNTPPSNGSIIKINYKNFNIDLLQNRLITGVQSGATSIVENVIGESPSSPNIYELVLNTKKTKKTFQNAEEIISSVFVNGEIVNVNLITESTLKTIEIINGGASYNVGDPVLLIGGSPQKEGSAVVEEVEIAVITGLEIITSGCGFAVNNHVEIVGQPPNFFDSVVSIVDPTLNNSTNVITFYSNTVNEVANVIVGNTTYANTNISVHLANTTITNVGSILSVFVLNSQPLLTTTVVFNTLSTPVAQISNTTIRVSDLGMIGLLSITNSGNNYQVNDELTFTNLSGVYNGHGAKAKVKSVNANGSITNILITDPGMGYKIGQFPTISISSANGTNAQVNVVTIMGEGDNFQATGAEDKVLGKILKVKIIDPGQLYTQVPLVDFSKFGNRAANGFVTIQDSYFSVPGKWKNSKGLISTEEMKLQGRDYYINFSYVLKSKVEFDNYKNLFKKFIHPAGTISYSEYNLPERQFSFIKNVIAEKPKVTEGSLSVSNNIITGSNTEFKVLNIQRGTHISVNGNVAITNTETQVQLPNSYSSQCTVIAVANTNNIFVGMGITGLGITIGTYVTEVNAISNTITLSSPTESSNTGNTINTFVREEITETRYVNAIVSNTEIIVTQPFTIIPSNNEIYKIVNKKVPDLIFLEKFITSASEITFSPGLSKKVNPGDLMIVLDSVLSKPKAVFTIPNNFIEIANITSNTISSQANSIKYLTSISSYKILDNSDYEIIRIPTEKKNFFGQKNIKYTSNTVLKTINTLSGNNFNNPTVAFNRFFTKFAPPSSKTILFFNPSSPISNIEISQINNSSNTGNLANQTLLTANSNETILIIAHYRTEIVVKSEINSNVQIEEIKGYPTTGPKAQQYSGYKIFNIGDNRPNTTIEVISPALQSDELRNLQTFYLKIT